MELDKLLDWAATHITRYTQSSVRITTSDGTIVDFDPSGIPPTLGPSDYILITHDHGDHFNRKVISKLLKPGTRLVVPGSVRRAGSDRGLATDGMDPGETKAVGSLTVTAIPAYNIKMKMHPREKGYLGYLVTLDGVKVYHAGDTDWIPEMTDLAPDIAFLPVGGGLVTMNTTRAVGAASALGARVVVPIHYGMVPFTGGAGKKFARAWTGVTELLTPGSGTE